MHAGANSYKTGQFPLRHRNGGIRAGICHFGEGAVFAAPPQPWTQEETP